ncbi:MAG: Phosphoribosyl 1,2-cyclic phosphate 1,2-diphosphodiesterase [Oscillospiraceae bacterium]
MTADLHCHTKMSDGSVGVEETVMLAAKRGISIISVTDHDTFSGSVRAGIISKKYGVTVIPGAEFSAKDPSTGRKAHILCYFCKNPDKLEDLCKHMQNERAHAAAVMMQQVMKIYSIPKQMILNRSKESTVIYKQHIMHALIDAGYANEFYGDVYHHLFHADKGLAYVPIHYPDVHEVIARIHQADGIAVLAHPGEYDSYELLKQLACDHEIDGVEVWHPSNKVGDEEFFSQIAQKYGLIMTGGTDFHGMYRKKCLPIGTCNTPETEVQKLIRLGTVSA